jgi:hypothetical protein
VFFPLSRHFRAGLSHAAVSRLEFGGFRFHRCPKDTVVTQTLDALRTRDQFLSGHFPCRSFFPQLFLANL